MPSFVELQKKAEALRALGWLLPKAQRAEFDQLQVSLVELANLVDDFYGILGDRSWVFHDMLPTSKVRDDVVGAPDEEAAESALCAIYCDLDQLRFMTGRMMRFEEMRARSHLIDRAVEDFAEGRYYAVVLVLLTVMDGFVNDVETVHRGLHARSADELQAWDTAVGHHQGLTAAQRSFTRSFSRRIDGDFRELARNGILHGNITGYDNLVVAAKAWNRLFAVVDWADSLVRMQTPKRAEPTWAETMAKVADTASLNRTMKQWKPSEGSTSGPDDYGMHPSVQAAATLLEKWRLKNWGHLANFLAPIGKAPEGNATPVAVRNGFGPYPITNFTISGYKVVAPAIAEVSCTLEIAGTRVEGKLRMLCVDGDGNTRVEGMPDALWKLIWRHPDMIAPDIANYGTF